MLYSYMLYMFFAVALFFLKLSLLISDRKGIVGLMALGTVVMILCVNRHVCICVFMCSGIGCLVQRNWEKC